MSTPGKPTSRDPKVSPWRFRELEGYRVPWTERDSAWSQARRERPYDDGRPDLRTGPEFGRRPRSPGRLFRSAAWDAHRQPLSLSAFHMGRAPTYSRKEDDYSHRGGVQRRTQYTVKSKKVSATHKSARSKKSQTTVTAPAQSKVPQIFRGANALVFMDFSGSQDGLVTRIKRYGGRMGESKDADYIILRTKPGQTRNATFLSAIRGERHPRKPGSSVVAKEWVDKCVDAGKLLDCTPYLVTAGPELPRASAVPMTPLVAASPPPEARKRVRPPTPDSRYVKDSTMHPPTPPAERPPTPSPALESSMESTLAYEDGLIDLDYEDGDEMLVDLDVHLSLPRHYDWSKTPHIDLPPTVLSTHVDAVRILISELTIWDGEGTKAECLNRIKDKVSQLPSVLP